MTEASGQGLLFLLFMFVKSQALNDGNMVYYHKCWNKYF